jgi:GT2 family glycosyltransferase
MADEKTLVRAGAPRAQVLVVVLNWKSAADTVRCLAALERSTYAHCTVLVVDNGSGDGSLERIRGQYPRVPTLALSANHGYAGGNNRGIRHGMAGCDYVWLLNPDTVVAPDCLAVLVEVAEADPRVGFLGPLVLMSEAPSQLLSAGGIMTGGWSRHRARGETEAGQFAPVAEVDYVMGCALLVRRQVIETVGLLDERYFLYGEEADWCQRGRAAGFVSVVVAAARAWHPDPATRDADSAQVTYYMARNQLLYVRQHRLGAAVLARHLLRHLRTLASWSLRPRWRNKGPQRAALRQALLDFARGRWGERA